MRDKLSLDEYTILHYIYKRTLNGESEFTQPMVIAERFNFSRNKIYLILDKLNKLGYVERVKKIRRESGGYYTLWNCTTEGARFISQTQHLVVEV
jgi:predicted transcriptional regulator